MQQRIEGDKFVSKLEATGCCIVALSTINVKNMSEISLIYAITRFCTNVKCCSI
jgi:hypothetical protein